MNVRFKITASLLASIRADLRRPHAHAHERVGFVAAGLATHSGGVLVLAHSYRPVADDDYLRDRSVGAMMGPEALRKALEWALLEEHALFHVHTHGGRGIPGFSGVDLAENRKFVPDFLKVAPQNIHGAIVLSDDSAAGAFWSEASKQEASIAQFVEVGPTVRKWGEA